MTPGTMYRIAELCPSEWGKPTAGIHPGGMVARGGLIDEADWTVSEARPPEG